MTARTTATLADATSTFAAVTLSAPGAHASTHTYFNQHGGVRCEISITPHGRSTLSVSDRARKAHPGCNPPEYLISAVKVEDNWAGTLCWNQSFTHPPQKLSLMSVRSGGGATIFAAPGGDLFVFDTVKMALIQAGKATKVLFPRVLEKHPRKQKTAE